jgi:hypothetical protein
MCSAVGARAVVSERCWVEIHSSGAGVKIPVTCTKEAIQARIRRLVTGWGLYSSIVGRDGASVTVFFSFRAQKQLTYASHLGRYRRHQEDQAALCES